MIEPSLFTRTRLQLLAGFLGVLAAILLLFCAGVGGFFRLALAQRFDQQLAAFAHAALSTIDIEEGEFDFRSAPQVSSQPLPTDTEVQWFDPEGRLLREVGALPGIASQLAERPTTGRFENLPGPLRAWVEPVRAPGGTLAGYLRVTRSFEAMEGSFGQLLWGLAAGIPAVLLVSAAGGWWLTGLVIRPVEDTLRRLEQFAADASHELRNPLMAIQSNCAVALKYPEQMRPGDRQKFLRIEDATRQLLTLVQELLMLARTGEGIAAPEPVDLAHLAQELVAEYRPRACECDLQLNLAIEPSPSSWQVSGKAVQLRCLCVNLIENAVKFTPEGGRIDVRLCRTSREVLVQVSDTGVGIAPTDLPHVFDRFWRADRSRHRQGGSGLGLAIARGIAEAHGGTLEARSIPEHGSTFTVRLPAVHESRCQVSG
ncbi:sensor histidine kinase [Gloeobacter morelensis]|uniref:histidine kinase n=1 Tax=Gloeobacter morelensis MG652769 TaxID=2781736 RepID=A0ABY3PSS2_9CYAN|nr:HAMP domain-containing sensor histidine kinase [Gloeobacter morelensis]UFP96750.1 HAMP domain-containing histidine kinase [Gloeobacter morelensis MG652769]